MGICEGYAIKFHSLASSTWMKCSKLQKAVLNVEHTAIEVGCHHFLSIDKSLNKLNFRTSHNAQVALLYFPS
jgi:hypothetical protein